MVMMKIILLYMCLFYACAPLAQDDLECAPAKIGTTKNLTCQMVRDRSCSDNDSLRWFIYKPGKPSATVKIVCSATACQGKNLPHKPFTTVSIRQRDGSHLESNWTIRNISSSLTLYRDSVFKCSSCKEKSLKTVCHLKVYALPQHQHFVVTKQHNAHTGRLDCLQLDYKGAGVFPPKGFCTFLYTLNDRRYVKLGQSPVTAVKMSKSKPSMYIAKCSMSLPAYVVPNGKLQFKAKLTLDLGDGETESGEDIKTVKTVEVALPLPRESPVVTVRDRWFQGTEPTPLVSVGEGTKVTCDVLGYKSTIVKITISCGWLSNSSRGSNFGYLVIPEAVPSDRMNELRETLCSCKAESISGDYHYVTLWHLTVLFAPKEAPIVTIGHQWFMGSEVHVADIQLGSKIRCQVFNGNPHVHRVNITCGLLRATAMGDSVELTIPVHLNSSLTLEGSSCSCTADHILGDYDLVTVWSLKFAGSGSVEKIWYRSHNFAITLVVMSLSLFVFFGIIASVAIPIRTKRKQERMLTGTDEKTTRAFQKKLQSSNGSASSSPSSMETGEEHHVQLPTTSSSNLDRVYSAARLDQGGGFAPADQPRVLHRMAMSPAHPLLLSPASHLPLKTINKDSLSISSYSDVSFSKKHGGLGTPDSSDKQTESEL